MDGRSIPMTELETLFDGLALPTEGVQLRFAVCPIEGVGAHILGKDPQGCPAILIEAGRDGDALMKVELQHLRVAHDLQCHIQYPSGDERTGHFTLIRCSGDEDIQRLFLRLVSALIPSLGTSPTRNDLARIIAKLVDLFRALTLPARSSTQGLWAELLLISVASNPARLIDAWHVDPTELFDFNNETERIEVKSSMDRHRRHQFRLEQLYPPPEAAAYVCSVVTERAGGGATIRDLVTVIGERVAARTDQVLKVETVVTETLGADWRDGSRLRFDRVLAESSLAFFPVQHIPKIPLEVVPPTISRVRFELILDQETPLTKEDLATRGALLIGAMPL
jgi:hypothetical protein